MKQDYFVCGFNGFKQFSSLIIKKKGNGEEGPGQDDDAHIQMPSALNIPIKLASECRQFLISWSAVYFLDEQGQMARSDLSEMIAGKKDECSKDFNCGSLYHDSPMNSKVKVEYPDCPRGFLPLPLIKIHKVIDISPNAFAITENGEVSKIICDEEEKAAADVAIIEDESGIHAKKHLALSKFTMSSDFEITSVSCGKEHALALTNTGRVYSFGLGSRGQLGTGSLENNEHPSLIEALQFVDIVMIAAAGWHSMALSGDGDVYSWGWNESGQLGIGCCEEENPRIDEEVFDCFCNKNKVCQRPMFSFVPQLVQFYQDTEIQSISCGCRHSAAASKSAIFTWGWNAYGQLGHGDIINRHRPKMIETFDLSRVSNIEVLCNAWNTMFCLTYV